MKRAIQAPESPSRTGTRTKAAPVVLRPKVKGKPEVKAMPKPKKMPQDSQLPPLKRMRMSPREPETPPPGHVVLVEPDLPQGRGAEIPQPSFPPRSRPREPSTPPPRRSDASSSGSAWRASRDWGDDRSQRRWRASSDEASALERHFDSIASIKGKRVQPPTRLW